MRVLFGTCACIMTCVPAVRDRFGVAWLCDCAHGAAGGRTHSRLSSLRRRSGGLVALQLTVVPSQRQSVMTFGYEVRLRQVGPARLQRVPHHPAPPFAACPVCALDCRSLLSAARDPGSARLQLRTLGSACAPRA